MVKKTISIVVVLQLVILLTWFFSFVLFLNLEVAFVSAFIVIVSSSYAHKQMIQRGVASGNFDDKHDVLDEIEDRFGLYDEEEETPPQEQSLKDVIKEEKAKIKTLNTASMKQGIKGGFSPLRLFAYLILVFGFIALENNEMLHLEYYLPALFVGIVSGSLVAREYLA